MLALSAHFSVKERYAGMRSIVFNVEAWKKHNLFLIEVALFEDARNFQRAETPVQRETENAGAECVADEGSANK